MTTAHIGIVITLFLIVVTVLLIWDEIRTERIAREWFEEHKHDQDKVEK